MEIRLDHSDLRPLVEQVVAEAVLQLQEVDARAGDRIAYTEADAAAMLSVGRHVLRDARLRGEVECSRVGNRIVYTREQLLQFLFQQRV